MAKFLSEEWGDQVRDALNDDETARNAAKGVQLTMQQVVNNVPGEGEIRYWTKIDDGSFEGGRGENPEADVTIIQEYETAAAMNRGELNAQAAFMQGKIKVQGNMGKLLQHQGTLQALSQALGQVPAEYD
ncbi:MAG TPA: SCP2 sterol-binding domain-containing protein [Actinomycetota bacterium]|nr:SCP2 sterol-binding domain-containing protein [Actinomycetota bacterium]